MASDPQASVITTLAGAGVASFVSTGYGSVRRTTAAVAWAFSAASAVAWTSSPLNSGPFGNTTLGSGPPVKAVAVGTLGMLGTLSPPLCAIALATALGTGSTSRL